MFRRSALATLGILIFVSSAWSQVSTSTDISSTTSGSVKRLFVQSENERLQHFVDNNFERLQESAAKGSGVVLNDYVHLLGCADSNDILKKAIQTNYSSLFHGGKAELIRKTEQMIEQDAEFMLSCGARS